MGRKTLTEPTRDDDAGRVLVTRGFLAETTDRNPEVVARHCHPVACDIRNRALLYDVDDAERTLNRITRTRRVRQAVDTTLHGVVPFAVQSCAQEDQDDDPHQEPWHRLDPDSLPPRNLARLAGHVQYLRRLGINIDDALFDRMVDVEREDLAAAQSKPRRAPRPSVVYYLRVGELVKIGYTTHLNSRLLAYPPHSVVLATEPGGPDVERARHLQFAADLAHGREWFRPSAPLIQHINTLRAEPLTPAELAA